MKLENIRKKYPDYNDMSDSEFAEKLLKKYPNMKGDLSEHLLSEKTVCVVDSGYFISLARKLSQTFKKVYYCTPTDKEFLSINDDTMGSGFPEIEKIDGYEFMRPEILKTIDLFCFPDIGYAPIQSYLKSIDKYVWGSFDATELEINRTLFLKTIKDLRLPVTPYKEIKGVTALCEYLQTVQKKWIKVDKYREQMETWFHRDFVHSESQLNHLAVIFGGAKETVSFVVQDEITTDLETGSDLWTIDGKYPSKYFQGYEKKNDLYIASLLPSSEMPKDVITINEKLSPLFKKYGYRNFFATEIRVRGDKPFFIDPTFRLPGMSGEQILETCSNLAYVIWYGAQGIFIEPEYAYKYAVTASAYYEGECGEDGWAIVRVPKETERWIKFAHCSFIDGNYHFPCEAKDLGVVIGAGNTLIEAFEMLKKNMDSLKDEPVYFKTKGFLGLFKSIRNAEKNGIKFSDDKLPEDKEILKYIE